MFSAMLEVYFPSKVAPPVREMTDYQLSHGDGKRNFSMGAAIRIP